MAAAAAIPAAAVIPAATVAAGIARLSTPWFAHLVQSMASASGARSTRPVACCAYSSGRRGLSNPMGPDLQTNASMIQVIFFQSNTVQQSFIAMALSYSPRQVLLPCV
eukprot:5649719-Pleurochrysis_carterae.AAC.2